MSQRTIETIIGRLITDEAFRSQFLKDPNQTLTALAERGLDLSRPEVAALVSTDPSLWARTADDLDPRLQKASLNDDPSTGSGSSRAASRDESRVP